MELRTEIYKLDKISKEKFKEIIKGWCAYSKRADCYELRKDIINNIG